MDRRARAPGPQMIWMAPGSRLTLPETFVTDIQWVPDDVRGLGGGGDVASHTLVEEQHHTTAGAMMWCGKCSAAGAAKQGAQTSCNSPVGSHCDATQSIIEFGMDWFGWIGLASIKLTCIGLVWFTLSPTDPTPSHPRNPTKVVVVKTRAKTT
eukprot:gene23724-biopygen14891